MNVMNNENLLSIAIESAKKQVLKLVNIIKMETTPQKLRKIIALLLVQI